MLGRNDILISPIIQNFCSQFGAYSDQRGIHAWEGTPMVSDSGGGGGHYHGLHGAISIVTQVQT